MKFKIPAALRVALYVGTLLGAPVVVYLRARGIIGDLELTLWGAEVSAVSTLAAFHVPSTADTKTTVHVSTAVNPDAAAAEVHRKLLKLKRERGGQPLGLD